MDYKSQSSGRVMIYKIYYVVTFHIYFDYQTTYVNINLAKYVDEQKRFENRISRSKFLVFVMQRIN